MVLRFIQNAGRYTVTDARLNLTTKEYALRYPLYPGGRILSGSESCIRTLHGGSLRNRAAVFFTLFLVL